VHDEVDAVLDAVDRCYEALGLEVAEVRLSTRGAPGSWAGGADDWDRAEEALRAVLADREIEAVEAPGEGAFYGPKIDVEVVDAHERTLTLSTVQVDLWMPERFDLRYVDSGGARRRPVMIHRSLLSTAERLVAHLLERHDGALPFWVAPEQVVVHPVSDDQAPAAAALASMLVDAGLRATSTEASSSLGRRIRASADRRVPVTLVLGAREVEADRVSVRLRGVGEVPGLDRAVCVDRLVAADRGRLALPALAA
jgi:threonyl-tRNA synthetase